MCVHIYAFSTINNNILLFLVKQINITVTIMLSKICQTKKNNNKYHIFSYLWSVCVCRPVWGTVKETTGEQYRGCYDHVENT